MTQTLDQMLDDYEAERIAEIEREERRRARPEIRAAIDAKRAHELAAQIRHRRQAARAGVAPISAWGIA